MLCEVETAILNLGLQLPNIHKTVIVTGRPDWATEGDYTSMLIQDWGVIRLYQAFLNDWTRVFRNATATGPGTCDPNSKKPLIVGPRKRTARKLNGSKARRTLKERKLNQQIRKPITLSPDSAVLHGRRKGFRRKPTKNRRRRVL